MSKIYKVKNERTYNLSDIDFGTTSPKEFVDAVFNIFKRRYAGTTPICVAFDIDGIYLWDEIPKIDSDDKEALRGDGNYVVIAEIDDEFDVKLKISVGNYRNVITDTLIKMVGLVKQEDIEPFVVLLDFKGKSRHGSLSSKIMEQVDAIGAEILRLETENHKLNEQFLSNQKEIDRLSTIKRCLE